MPVEFDPAWEYYVPDPEYVDERAFKEKEFLGQGFNISKRPNGRTYLGKEKASKRQAENRRTVNYQKCLKCEARFVPRYSTSRYCSRRCSNSRCRERRRLMANCLACGKQFAKYKKKLKYCSRGCFNTNRPSPQQREEKQCLTAKCLTCGNEFAKPRKESKFCSYQCRPGPSFKRPVHPCERCQALFQPQRDTDKKCTKCRNGPRHKWPKASCAQCGAIFQPRGKRSMFCSLTCSWRGRRLHRKKGDAQVNTGDKTPSPGSDEAIARGCTWKEIPGYEGKYAVSSNGDVLSLRWEGSERQKLLSKNIRKGPRNAVGYNYVRLHKNGAVRAVTCARLVLETFNPGDEGREVNHKDGNTLNDSLSNLEWVTRSENQKHAIETGLAKPPPSANPIGSGKKYHWVNKSGESRWATPMEISREFSISYAYLYKMAQNKESHKTFHGWSIQDIPNPGSDAAIKLFCLCPVLDNAHGKGSMYGTDTFVISHGCPLHWPIKSAEDFVTTGTST